MLHLHPRIYVGAGGRVSLDAQRDKLRKYAEYQDMTVVSEFSDEGFSGKNIKGRPEFTRMMEQITNRVKHHKRSK